MGPASKSRLNSGLTFSHKLMIGAGSSLILLGLGIMVAGDQGGRPLESLDRSLPSTYSNGCHLPSGESEPLPCFNNLNSEVPTIYLVGDSHAAQWIPGIENGNGSSTLKFRFLTKSSCPFVLLELNPDCDLWISNVLREIIKDRPNMVIIANLTNGKYLNFYADDTYASLWISRFDPLLQKISGLTKILIIEDTPYSSIDTSECLISRSQEDCNFSFNQSKLTSRIKSYANANNFSYVSFKDRLCFNSVCKSGDSTINYYRDENHISVSLSAKFGPSLNEYLQRLIAN